LKLGAGSEEASRRLQTSSLRALTLGVNPLPGHSPAGKASQLHSGASNGKEFTD
jgi:hypothetical protein